MLRVEYEILVTLFLLLLLTMARSSHLRFFFFVYLFALRFDSHLLLFFCTLHWLRAHRFATVSLINLLLIAAGALFFLSLSFLLFTPLMIGLTVAHLSYGQNAHLFPNCIHANKPIHAYRKQFTRSQPQPHRNRKSISKILIN